MTLRMFVWVDPYAVRYGSSEYRAIAETVEQARAMAADAKHYEYSRFDIVDDLGREHPRFVATYLSKDPDRIVDLPCAEWNEWSE